MKRLVLMLLVGFGIVLLQAAEQDEEIEYEYIEEFEEFDGDSQSKYDDEGVGYYTDDTSLSADAADESQTVETDLEITYDNEFTDETSMDNINSDNMAYSEDDTHSADSDYEAFEGHEIQQNKSVNAMEQNIYEKGNSGRVQHSADLEENDKKTDITRWNYTDEEIAKKEAIRIRQAKRETEYQKSITRNRSGVFTGVGLGYSSSSRLSDAFKITSQGLGVGVFFGYQKAFNEYSGIRSYGEVNYNLGSGVFIARLSSGQYNFNDIMLKMIGNMDFYLEGSMGRGKTETLGAFFGLGAGYIYSSSKADKSNMVVMTLNFGIHSIIGTHHRIELFGRVYPYGTTLDNIQPNIDAWLRYSYMF